MNPRKNIWINKSNLERFELEPNKSGLINELLAQHYAQAPAIKLTQPELNEVVQKRVARVRKDLTPTTQPQEEPTMFAPRKPLWKKSAKV